MVHRHPSLCGLGFITGERDLPVGENLADGLGPIGLALLPERLLERQVLLGPRNGPVPSPQALRLEALVQFSATGAGGGPIHSHANTAAVQCQPNCLRYAHALETTQTNAQDASSD